MNSKILIAASVYVFASAAYAQEDIDLGQTVVLRVDPADNAISGECVIIADDGARSTKTIAADVAEQSWKGRGAECKINNEGSTAVTIEMVTALLGLEQGQCQGSTSSRTGGGFSMSGGSCPYTIEPGAQASVIINNG